MRSKRSCGVRFVDICRRARRGVHARCAGRARRCAPGRDCRRKPGATSTRVVQYAVAYDHCRGDYELDDREADSFVAMLSEAIQELPQYTTLDVDSRKALLLNLLMEMQREAAAAPAPDCAVARIGGKRVSIEHPGSRS